MRSRIAQVTPFQSGPRLQGLPPLVNAHTRVLVLGSFPGAASLAAQQYYGHPRNRFWPVMAHVIHTVLAPGARADRGDDHRGHGHHDRDDPQDPHGVPHGYAERCAWLLAHGVGLWDVLAACQRPGSLDADIRAAEPNDLAPLLTACPRLRCVVHNGSTSAQHARRTQALFGPHGVRVLALPSTSPANAAWRLDRLQAAWAAALAPVATTPAG